MNKIDVLKLDNEKHNKIYSPYSISMAISMLNEGATGKTKEELELFLNNEKISKYNTIDNILSIANKLYIKNNIATVINDEYKNVLKEKYDTEVELNDFNNSEIINQWISNKTFGQIKNVINDDMLKISNFLLINTLAVDMEWQNTIGADTVGSGPFYGEKEINASYIRGFNKNMTSYYETDEIVALGINLKEYYENKFDCVLIQPKESKLDEYINNLNDNMLNIVLSSLKSLNNEDRKVIIHVPKFSFSYNLDTKKMFENMGVNSLFTNPSLEKISKLPSYDLNIIHKANIDFSEKGLKAAAATVITLLCGSAMDLREPLFINIDKPFLFLVRNKNNNDILFMGTVYEPVLWIDDQKNYSYEG